MNLSRNYGSFFLPFASKTACGSLVLLIRAQFSAERNFQQSPLNDSPWSNFYIQETKVCSRPVCVTDQYLFPSLQGISKKRCNCGEFSAYALSEQRGIYYTNVFHVRVQTIKNKLNLPRHVVW